MLPLRRVRRIALAMLICWPFTHVMAEVPEEIASLEKLQRSKRLRAYELLFERKNLTDAERLLAVKAFAAHAKKLSPQYGESLPKINAKRWRQILVWGHEQDTTHSDIAEALCQLLIDEQKIDDAAPIARAFLKAHPDNHEAKAYVDWCSRASKKGEAFPVLEFPLHFCVLTRHPEATKRVTEEQCRKEIDIFNKSFVGRDRKPLVQFLFKRLTPYSKVAGSDSPLISVGDSQRPYQTDKVAEAFNASKDPNIRDSRAINVYVFDSYSPKVGFRDVTSHGKRNANHPYVLIDWERLGANLQNAEPHEMGHAFGLEHVGVPGARLTSSTNIMASAGEEFGSGGKRDLAFTDSQCAVILYHANRTYSRLGLSKR